MLFAKYDYFVNSITTWLHLESHTSKYRFNIFSFFLIIHVCTCSVCMYVCIYDYVDITNNAVEYFQYMFAHQPEKCLCFQPCNLFSCSSRESVHSVLWAVWISKTYDQHDYTCLLQVLEWSSSRKKHSFPSAVAHVLNHAIKDELIYVANTHCPCFSKETLQVAQRTFTGAVIDVYEGAEPKLECMWKYSGRSYIAVTRYKGWHPQNNPTKGI